MAPVVWTLRASFKKKSNMVIATKKLPPETFPVKTAKAPPFALQSLFWKLPRKEQKLKTATDEFKKSRQSKCSNYYLCLF